MRTLNGLRKSWNLTKRLTTWAVAIERRCLQLLLQQQPVAKDLRTISAALKMITDMERIGDQSADISEITILLSKTPYIKKLETIPEMAAVTSKMVKHCIDAYVEKRIWIWLVK